MNNYENNNPNKGNVNKIIQNFPNINNSSTSNLNIPAISGNKIIENNNEPNLLLGSINQNKENPSSLNNNNKTNTILNNIPLSSNQQQKPQQIEDKPLFNGSSINPIYNIGIIRSNISKDNINPELNQPVQSSTKNISPITNNLLNNTYKNDSIKQIEKESNKKIINSTIYPIEQNTPISIFMSSKDIPTENNFESRKNILGISRSEISERVIDAISKKLSIKEFFVKASEDVVNQSRYSGFKKQKQNESLYEIFDESFARSNDSYLETKYQMYLQREIIKQKQKMISKNKKIELNSVFDYSSGKEKSRMENYFLKAKESDFQNFKKKNYLSLVEKNYEINKQESPLNYNLAEVNKINNFNFRNSINNFTNYNKKNYNLIKIINEENFENVENLNMKNLCSDNVPFSSKFEKSDIKNILIQKEEDLDLHNFSLIQEKKAHFNIESQKFELLGITKHINKLKGGINKLFSIFNPVEEEEEIDNFIKEKDFMNISDKKILGIIAEIKDKNTYLSFHAHRNSTVDILKEYIIEKLLERNSIKYSYLKKEDLLILFKSCILVDEKTLGSYEFDLANENLIQVVISTENKPKNNIIEDFGVINNANDSLFSLRDNNINIYEHLFKKFSEPNQLNKNEKKEIKKISKSPGKEKTNINSNTEISKNSKNCNDTEEKKNTFSSENLFPKFNNEFDINPNIQIIYRMNKFDLKNVEGFSISNNFGKIKFKHKVDLTNLNLSEIVLIDLYNIEIYPGRELPNPGEGLNKPAIITMKQMFNENENLNEYVNRIKEKGGKFLKYNELKGKFKFEVEKWMK